MAAAIKRPLGEDQQLAPLDALKALTLLPARQLGEEKIKGSIAAGKLADFAVLRQPAQDAGRQARRDPRGGHREGRRDGVRRRRGGVPIAR
jgi:imidazolonepropionase-like amidohydrolase